MINPEGFTRAQKYGILGSQKVNEWRRKRREAKRRAENGEKSSESEAEVEYEDNEPASSDTQESDVGETSNGSTVAVDMQRHPIKRESYLLSDGDGARAAGIEDMGSRKDLETHENREQLIAQAVVTGIPQIPQNPESRPDASTMSIKTEPTDPSETLAPVAMIGSEYAARANSSSIDEEYDIPVAPLVPLSTQIGRRQTTSIILQGVQLLTNIFVSGKTSTRLLHIYSYAYGDRGKAVIALLVQAHHGYQGNKRPRQPLIWRKFRSQKRHIKARELSMEFQQPKGNT